MTPSNEDISTLIGLLGGGWGVLVYVPLYAAIGAARLHSAMGAHPTLPG